MAKVKHVIIGCGDVGRRIAAQLITKGEDPLSILGIVQSRESAINCANLGIDVERLDFDQTDFLLSQLDQANCYYLVPPQKSNHIDLRSRSALANMDKSDIKPNKVVLISTTGVYGDCAGEWVTEQNDPNPKTERGQRRLDAETQWSTWANTKKVDYVILRVPGIYARSRIPRKRIEQGIPVVRASECGYTNRIHADDLARISIAAMQNSVTDEIYNATDGVPGKITEYLQAAAAELKLAMPPEISMQEARTTLSAGMLSYLGESRKISNKKMLAELKVTLHYPNFRQGLKSG